jgi:hypothetical protein
MAYIEENLKIRSRPQEDEEDEPADPQDELYRIAEKWKVEKKAAEEGSVTNSLSMLTAIPEVDLGMEYVSSLLYTCPTNSLPRYFLVALD